MTAGIVETVVFATGAVVEVLRDRQGGACLSVSAAHADLEPEDIARLVSGLLGEPISAPEDAYEPFDDTVEADSPGDPAVVEDEASNDVAEAVLMLVRAYVTALDGDAPVSIIADLLDAIERLTQRL